MGFPFINKPFDKWVVDKIDNKSNNRIQLNKLTPFIWMTSGAVVASGKMSGTVDSSISSAKYNGCVISNHTSIGMNYSLNDTMLGYDLNGKLIKVPGEKGRKISPPVIESMEIDTDGENNTLKVAKINVVLFSLKQLEMFELFFLKPSMTVVLEYGNNDPQTKTNVAANSFIKGKTWTSFKNEVVNYYSPKPNDYLKYRNEYLNKLKNTNGDYDFWIAKVTNFNVEFDSAENIYKVLLEVSSGNELQLWMPIDQQDSTTANKTRSGKVVKPTSKNDAESWMLQLCSELGLSSDLTEKLKIDAKKYTNEFFNWGIINSKSGDNTYSKEQYVSFKLILDIMNNVEVFKAYDKKIDYTQLSGLTGDIIPVSSHKDIISTNRDFILPGSKLPKFIVDPNDTTKIVINGTYDGKINGKSFNINSDDKSSASITSKLTGEKLPTKGVIGNLLNVFVRKQKFVNTFKEQYTFSDFYEIMLGMINDYMYGLCKLEIGQLESANRPAMTIIDKKLRQPTEKEINITPYRFSLHPTKSIVHSLTFNIEMSNLMQAQALYESQLDLYEKKPDDPKNVGAAFVQDKYYMKMIGQSNSDMMYSVDAINYFVLQKSKDWQKKNTIQQQVPDKPVTKKEVQEQLKNASAAITKKYVKFKKDQKNANPVIYHLIYEDYNLVQSKISTDISKSSVLTYLECELVIDGMSGFRCGELFKLDGIPELYNQNGSFQILNIKQSIQNDTGWRTTISAGFRYNIQ